MKNRFLTLISVIIFFLIPFSMSAQNFKDDTYAAFEKFKIIPESNIFLHLNKSILLNGEDLGFTAYVLDHKSQLLSKDVKNLYCQLLDSNKKVIKEQLLKVDNGVVTSKMSIDSLVPPGDYSIRGFTNWMRNFDKPLFFESSIKILSNEKDKNKPAFIKNTLDIQVLPEGGNLLENVLSNVGVSIRDEKGRGIANIDLELLKNGERISTFQLDKNGLGRFSMIPDGYSYYSLKYLYDGLVETIPIPIERKNGIVLSVSKAQNKIFVSLKTNEQTLETLSNPSFVLALNGNDKLNLFDVDINEIETTVVIDEADSQPGVNQISLMKKDKSIVASRMFFNSKDLKRSRIDRITFSKELDTLNGVIEIDNINNGTLSVSVLPLETITLDNNSSILSKFKLEPFLNGVIQNPLEYFENTSSKSLFQMDNLMLCHGWVMYDWKSVFDLKKNYVHDFEQGLSIKASFIKSRPKKIMIYPTLNTGTSFIDLENNKDFVFGPYFPTEKEKLRISKVDKKGGLSKMKIIPNFNPSSAPSFNFEGSYMILDLNEKGLSDIEFTQIPKGVEQFDEVLLYKLKDREARRSLLKSSRASVDIFNDNDRRNTISIVQYLLKKGFTASDSNGEIEISDFRAIDRSVPPLINLDGFISNDPNILRGLQMNIVDYIEIDFSGFTTVGDARGGSIKIVTNPSLNPFENEQPFSSYNVPLTFTKPSKFSRPNYQNYYDDFFNKLGVMDWIGELKIIDGKAHFKTPFLGKKKFLLRVQGILENGSIVDEFKAIELSD